MIFIYISFGINVGLILIRGIIFKNRNFKINYIWWLLIICSLIANIIAFFGFQNLLDTLYVKEESNNYTTILTIFSLLSSGIIAGNFAFSYQDSADDEGLLTNAISIVFISLFYLLFSLVNYYTGKSIEVNKIDGLRYILPTIMTLILIANTLYNYWDYREIDE